MQPTLTTLTPAEHLLVLLISKENFSNSFICLVDKETDYTELKLIRLSDELLCEFSPS